MAMLAEQDCNIFLFCEFKSLMAVYDFEQEETHIADPQYYMWHVQAVYRQIFSAVCSEQQSITRGIESSVVAHASYIVFCRRSTLPMNVLGSQLPLVNGQVGRNGLMMLLEK